MEAYFLQPLKTGRHRYLCLDPIQDLTVPHSSNCDVPLGKNGNWLLVRRWHKV